MKAIHGQPSILRNFYSCWRNLVANQSFLSFILLHFFTLCILPIGIKEWLRKTEATRGSMLETLCLQSRFPSRRKRPAARAIQKAARHLAVNRLVSGLEGSVLCSKRGRKSKKSETLGTYKMMCGCRVFSGVCEVFGNTISVLEYVTCWMASRSGQCWCPAVDWHFAETMSTCYCTRFPDDIIPERIL